MKCTWNSPKAGECTASAIYPQCAKDGTIWARLCEKHANYLDRAVLEGGAKVLLGVWVAAQGGPKAAAGRTFPA